MKHTPTPWTYIGDQIIGIVADCDCPLEPHFLEGIRLPPHEAHDVVIPKSWLGLPEEITQNEFAANMKFIVHACNNFDAMLQALKNANDLFDNLLKAVDWGTTHNLDMALLNKCLIDVQNAIVNAKGNS